MNASFLLMTASLLTGQNVVPVNHPAPVYSAPVVSSSNCGCAETSHGFSLGLRDRLRGMFSHGSSCDSCQPVTPCCTTPAPKVVHHAPKAPCAPVASCSSCDPCASGHRFQLFGKLRGMFHRNDACCDGGCSSTTATTGGCAPSTALPPSKEVITNPPKKMPAPPEKGKDGPPAKTTFNSTPLAPVNPAAPALEVVTPTAPAASNFRRDPF